MLKENHKKTVHFFAPGLKHYDMEGFFPITGCGLTAVSITGSSCALRCLHCDGVILRSMVPTTTPEVLFSEAMKAASKGSPGLLISGGSTSDGHVPLSPFVETIARIKSELRLNILVHTGLVDGAIAEALAQARIDCAMIDIVGDDDTITKVCRLPATTEDYASSLELLVSKGVPTAPHVIMGLHFGELRGEFHALSIVARYPVKAVVLVIFRPLPGTRMQHVMPIKSSEIAEIFVQARRLFPDTPVLLGCERPLGEHREEIDRLSLEAGIDGIAFPSESAFKWARDRGIEIRLSRNCCSMIQCLDPETSDEKTFL